MTPRRTMRRGWRMIAPGRVGTKSAKKGRWRAGLAGEAGLRDGTVVGADLSIGLGPDDRGSVLGKFDLNQVRMATNRTIFAIFLQDSGAAIKWNNDGFAASRADVGAFVFRG